MDEKMKVLRVVIITIVVMILISCATTPKAQNVEIDRTARAHELIAEGLALLVAEHAERADEQISETGLRTLKTLARTIRVEAERVLSETKSDSDCSYALELSTCCKLTLFDGESHNRMREITGRLRNNVEITEELINSLKRYGIVVEQSEDGNIIRFTNQIEE